MSIDRKPGTQIKAVTIAIKKKKNTNKLKPSLIYKRKFQYQ